jgi:hypothetical protein
VGGGVAPGGSIVAWRWPPHLGWGPDWPFPGYLESFGIPLFLGIGGFALALRRRWEVGCVAFVVFLASFAAPHLVEFRQSPPNTAKLFVASTLACALAGGPALAVLAARLRSPRRLLAVTLLLSCTSPVLFLWVRAWGPLGCDVTLPPIPPMLLPPPAGGVDRSVGEWLAANAAPEDVVLTVSPYLTPHSGVPSFAPQEGVWAWYRALDPSGEHGRNLERLWRNLDPELLARYRIRWVVVGPEEERRMGPEARKALGEGARFERVPEVTTGRERRVWRVTRRGVTTAAGPTRLDSGRR